MGYVAFDLEIAKPVTGSDWKEQRPLGISCAATRKDGTGISYLWHGHLPPLLECDGESLLPEKMTGDVIEDLVNYLWSFHRLGNHIVTFNGLGFDFDVLAEECVHDWAKFRCAEMAMNHIDIGFAMLCDKGYMIGLDTMAHGLGVGGKTEGMHGDLAPLLWNGLSSDTPDKARQAIATLGVEPGTRVAQALCLEYVAQDAKLTADVYEGLLEKRSLTWITKKGTTSYYPWVPRVHDGRLLTVAEALETPEPDTSWMSSKRERSSFYKWTERYWEQLEMEV
jgi:hypothetical protein